MQVVDMNGQPVTADRLSSLRRRSAGHLGIDPEVVVRLREVIRDAVHVHGSILQLLHHRAEVLGLGRVLKINWDVRVGHTKTANAPRPIRENFLVRVEREIEIVRTPSAWISASCVSVG
jgi:hypothetical protein